MNSSTSTTRLSDNERVRWVMLGLGSSEDLTDIPEDRIRVAKENVAATAIEFSRSRRERRSSRSIPFAKTAVVASCMLLLSCLLFSSIQNAVAEQQVRSGNQYARQLMEFSLDLFEEDWSILADKAVRSDILLPEPMYWSADSFTYQQMRACPQAIQALTAVRMGLPNVGLSQLNEVADLLHDEEVWSNENDPDSSRRDLEFIFHLTAGKTLFESVQTVVGRSYLDRSYFDDSKQIAFESIDSLQHAYDLLQQGEVAVFSERDQEMLKCAIQIDLGRGRTKFGRGLDTRLLSQSPEQFYRETYEIFVDIEKQLKELEIQDDRWLVQYARCVNNRILSKDRIATSSRPLNETELGDLIIEFKDELEELELKARSLGDSPHSSAAWFEIAICYSNLADQVYTAWELSDVDSPEILMEDRIRLREKAAEYLMLVPRVNRTERHFENLISNLARSILESYIVEVTKSESYVPSSELVGKATLLRTLAGSIFDTDKVGQFPVDARLAVALVLADTYSIEEIRRFISKLPKRTIETDRSLKTLVRHFNYLAENQEN